MSLDPSLNPDGSRPVTVDEERALKQIIRGGVTFGEATAPIEAHLRRVIERHGGIRGDTLPPAIEGTVQSGYVIAGPIEEDSELDYALKILGHLTFATSNDIEEARLNAWLAGVLTMEAAIRFRWERHALRGKKALADAQHALTAARIKRRKRASSTRSRAGRWDARVRELTSRMSQESAYQKIARDEDRKPDTIKKAVLRFRDRRKKINSISR